MSEVMLGQWLLAAAVRSMLVLLVVWLLVVAFHRSSAAVLYRIWFLGLMSCLILLPIGSVLPQWKLGVLPAEASSQMEDQSIRASLDGLTINPYRIAAEDFDAEIDVDTTQAQEPVFEIPKQLPDDSMLPEQSLESFSIPAVPARAVEDAPSRPVPLASIAVVFWIIGVVLLICRYVWHWNVARMLRGSCRVRDDDQWQEVARQCARALHIKRSIKVAFHASNISPMVVGILKPVVLLPESSNDWNLDRRRLVLMHELSHIQRNDLLSQFFASLTCAIYWFNPLVWIASRQMKKLREIACDDEVVRQTAEPELYAEVLLNVALTQRQRPLTGAIAMARANNVKDRIVCILDSARRRNPLNRRWAVGLAILAIGVSAIIGTGSLTSRAQDPKQADTKSEETKVEETKVEEDATEETKEQADTESANPPKQKRASKQTMLVRVLDENGKPFPAVDVHVSVFDFVGKEIERYAKPDLQTNDSGEATATFPNPTFSIAEDAIKEFMRNSRKMDGLRISVSKPGYVPLSVSFRTTFLAEDERLPPSYEFRMQQGEKLSGRIVDQNGNPVVGAKVQVEVETHDLSIGPDASPSYGALAQGKAAATTNKSGVWELVNAPSQDVYAGGFKLKVNHPWYAGDKEWGELQKEQGVTTQQLRDGTAIIKLNRGVRLTGIVSDAQGKTLEKGMIVWSRAPFDPNETKDVPIGPAGRYETEVLRPGSYRITVSSPGYAPQQRDVELAEDMQELNFSLQAGHVIKFRIVDASGNLIPKAAVAVGNWRGSQCLYEAFLRTTKPEGEWVKISNNSRMFVSGDSGNDAKSSILIHPNKDGLWIWDSAPEDEVVYSFSALQYRGVELSLVAGPDVKEIRLGSEPTIFGKVTDKVTGEPVKAFQVSRVDVPHGLSSMTEYAQGTDGQYRLVIERAWQKGTKYKVRIEAAGYRTAFGTKEISVGDEPIQEDFALEPANAIAAQVLAPDGKPVKEFGFHVFNSTYPAGMHSTERSGQLTLAATVEPVLIRIDAAEGYAELVVDPNDQVPEVKLQPWASVQGRLTQGGQSMSGATVQFKRTGQVDRVRITHQEDFKAKTDKDGNYRFKKLPPVEGRITADLNLFEETKLMSIESRPVQLESGKTVEIDMGNNGVTLIGRVVASGRNNEASTKEWSVNYLIRRDESIEQASSDFAGPMNFEWLKKTGLLQWVLFTAPSDFQEWMFRQQHYAIKLNKDGTFQVSGVQPGPYDLLVQLYDKPEMGLVETVGQKIVPITIAADQAVSGRIDVGNIDISCKHGPRVDSDMRAYQFTDASGTSRQICDAKGQYQLVHIWAAWNENSVEALPMMVDRLNQIPKESISVTSFNVDGDSTNAKALVERFNIPWTQNYVGESTDLLQALSITTLPAYYLIGPDGKLIASSEFWVGIDESLKKQFQK